MELEVYRCDPEASNPRLRPLRIRGKGAESHREWGKLAEGGGATAEWAARRRAIVRGLYWSSPTGRRPRWNHGIFSVALAIFGIGLRLTPLFRRGRRNALDLELAELEIPLAGLPKAFDGYRILHLSDTHLDALPAIADAAQPLFDGLDVDLVALTGDVHSYPRHPVSRSVGMLKRVLSGVTVRDRRLAVLGNHDPVEMVDALAALGFETLVNDSTKLQRNGDRVHVTGVDDVHSFYAPEALATLQAQGTVAGFKIALVHSGEMADHAANAGFSLYLCGHTHAGQIALPNGKLVFTQLVRCRHTAAGLWQEGQMVGYTSAGLGVSPPTVRFNTRGGAALITLRRQEVVAPGTASTVRHGKR